MNSNIMNVMAQVIGLASAKGLTHESAPGGNNKRRDAMKQLMLSALLTLGVAVSATAAEPSWIGYYGPGARGYFPDANPPTKVTQDDIAWQCELPSWGHGQPMEINGKVFLLSEPWEGKRLFPSLTCIDAKTGTILWDRDLDQTVGFPATEREPIVAAWKEVMKAWGEDLAAACDYETSKDAEALKAAGYKLNNKKQVVSADPSRPERVNAAFAVAMKGGFDQTCWRNNNYMNPGYLGIVGQAFAAPVSDGQRVYATTGYGGTFCFDFNGKLLWSAFTLLPRIGPFGDPDGCARGRSPILWEDGKGGGLLITDIGNKLRAYDKLTGELKCADDLTHHTIITPGIITVDGTDILYAAGNAPYELPSGKKLTVEGWKDAGMTTLVKHDEPNVIFFTGVSEHCGWTGKGGVPKGTDPAIPRDHYSPPAMVRFDRTGDVLKATVLWDGLKVSAVNELEKSPGFLIGAAYHDGKFYGDGKIIEVATAKVLPGTSPEAGRARLVAQNRVYGVATMHRGWGEKSQAPAGSDEIGINVTGLDGSPIAKNMVFVPKSTGGFGTDAMAQRFSYGDPWCLGQDAIYLRGWRWLIKVGGKIK